MRVLSFVVGEILIAIAFCFRTTLPLQIYELLVVEIAKKYKLDNSVVKRWTDATFFILSVALAYGLNGSLKGIGIGTIIITIVNASLIKFFGSLMDKVFTFETRFKVSNIFIGKE